MSDEEKKAIERLIIYKDKIKDELYPIIDFEEEKAIGIILNLIEKQSKEIEEYKKQLDLDYVDKHFVPIERYNQLEKEIEELNRLKGFEMLDIFNMGKQSSRQRIEFDYVDKDKIKAKIEELDNQKRQWIEDRNNKHKDSELIYAIEVLQSLLEKE